MRKIFWNTVTLREVPITVISVRLTAMNSRMISNYGVSENEMDGPWQMGHKSCGRVRKIAAETARLMKFMDRRLRLLHAEAPIWKCLPLAPGSIRFLTRLTIRWIIFPCISTMEMQRETLPIFWQASKGMDEFYHQEWFPSAML